MNAKVENAKTQANTNYHIIGLEGVCHTQTHTTQWKASFSDVRARIIHPMHLE